MSDLVSGEVKTLCIKCGHQNAAGRIGDICRDVIEFGGGFIFCRGRLVGFDVKAALLKELE